MTTKQIDPVIRHIEQHPPKGKRSCSLSRVILAVVLGAAAIIGGANYQYKPVVEFTPVESAQLFQPGLSEPHCARGPLTPYFGPTRRRAEPAPISPVESLISHPGIVTLKSQPDKGYANEEENFEQHKTHIRYVKQVYRQVKNLPAIKEAEASAETSDANGFAVKIQDPSSGKNTTCLYALNSRLVENHQKATEHLQIWIQDLDQLSEKQICDEIRQGHKILMTRVGSRKAGKYRNQGVLVFRDNAEDQDRSPKAMMALIKKRGGTDKQARIYRDQVLTKLQANKEDFTPAEKEVVGMIGYLAPPSHEIALRMREYAKDLKAMAHQMKTCENFDPIAYATYAHQEMGKIHPFEDGNGRMARLVMNGILRLAGYPAAVFPSDDEYTNAVNGDFAAYLRGTAIPLTEKYFGPGGPCLPELTC